MKKVLAIVLVCVALIVGTSMAFAADYDVPRPILSTVESK